ncbi:MAG: ribonuclease P protein component [bacterium]
MLKPENRLKKVRDFNLVIKHGRWVNADFLDLKYVELVKNKEFFPKKSDPTEFVQQLKVAFVVGVKISKSAVRRNRLKRQMREVVRLLIKDSALKQGCYLMILAKKSALDREYTEIEQEIQCLLRKARIYV